MVSAIFCDSWWGPGARLIGASFAGSGFWWRAANSRGNMACRTQSSTVAGRPATVEDCVLHAMFPREFAALHQKPLPAKEAPISLAPGPHHESKKMALTIEGKRTEVTVTVLSDN